VTVPTANATAVVHRLRTPTRVRSTATLPLVTDPACGDTDDGCAVIAAAVAPDGRAVALLRRGEEALTLARCNLTLAATSTASDCVPAGTLTHPASTVLARADVRLTFEGDDIVGAAPGVIFGAIDGELVRVDIAGFIPRADVRRIGECIVTASSRRAFFVPLANPDRFGDVVVDGEIRSVLGVGAGDDAFVYAAGGAESFAGTIASAQLYRMPLSACAPRSADVQIPGGLRGQADIIGIGVDAEGGIFVGDAAEGVWQVLPAQAASGN
jgi:hypothetical protein